MQRDRATPERRRRDHRVKEITKGLLAAGQYTADHRRAGFNAFAKAATVCCLRSPYRNRLSDCRHYDGDGSDPVQLLQGAVLAG